MIAEGTQKAQKNTRGTKILFVPFSLLVFLFPSSLVYGQRKVWDGVYTADQARRGKAEFDQTCSRCHNLALIGSERGPAIKGPAFLAHWDKGSVADLFIKIRETMPKAGQVHLATKLRSTSFHTSFNKTVFQWARMN